MAIRAVIWLLALIATAGAVLSVHKVLRNRSADEAAVPTVILPPPSGGKERSVAKGDNGNPAASTAKVESAAKAAGGNAAHDTISHDNAAGQETAHQGTGRQATAHQQTAHDDRVPTFDVARVEPSGDTVIAGRATPGATVELLRNGKVHDRVVADASGQFAMVPPRLPAGESELSLRSTPPNGAPVVSRQTVVVSVQQNLKDRPVVALMAPDKPSVVLSKPAEPSVAGGSVVVETVEAAAGGKKLFVTGHAAPGALVRLYINDGYQSTATANGNGRVAFTATGDGPGRDYRVRLDEVDRASGVIKSRAEVPFTAPEAVATADSAAPAKASNDEVSGSRALAPSRTLKKQTFTVSRGDSLWRISRLTYGDGARYTVIYDANHKQIRNPDRIYPGQVFVIPAKRR